MVVVRSPRALEFACNAKSCAPPPVGSGGSKGSGSSQKKRRVAWNSARAKAKKEDKARADYRASLQPGDPNYSPR